MNSLDVRPQRKDSLPGNSEVSVLIVDDEHGDRETLEDIFLEKGYRVETAATGQEALQKARGRFFHAAILDVRLPDMIGTELLARLKDLQPDTAVVMATGYASLQTCVRAVNAGASAYLVKPLDLEHVLSVLEQALGQQRAVFESRRLLDQYRERIQDLEGREDQLSERLQRLEQEISALRESGAEKQA